MSEATGNRSLRTGVSVRVRVTPRGGKDAVIGYRPEEELLLLRVAAPPVDGAANRACLELVAAVFGLRRHQVTLLSGETSREKRFGLTGIDEAERERRLAELSSASQT
ncbi:MAG: DUF167 domain-containing protein [Capsulimonadales bacterium]|nr:DUF167 domain-containing protein [Capsulimonadales bacterium]